MKHVFTGIRNRFRIRSKLLLSYSAVFILAVSLSSLVIYFQVYRIIEGRIESELKASTSSILSMVRTAAAVSIKNRLRAVAEKNLEIAEHFHNQFRRGILSEADARRRTEEVFLSQTIGTSGYIYCINSNGETVLHPNAANIGVNYSNHPFVRIQTSRKDGYVEYDWKNPGESKSRPKATYMTYFEPWDWIISVSSYREEFKELVNTADFRESILARRFGLTGYSFVMDSRGNLIIHPQLEGHNYFNAVDLNGRQFVQEVCRRKNGKILYTWKNPHETFPRQKIAIFNYIPEMDWIVESSGYLDEFHKPLRTLQHLFAATVIGTLLLVLILSFRISASITRPLQGLMERFAAGSKGDFSNRMSLESQDEVGQLARYFNSFMEALETSHAALEEEIQERKQIEAALRTSEEMFAKAFRLSPNGIAITSLRTGRFLDINQSFLSATGFDRRNVIGRTLAEVGIIPDREDRIRLLSILEEVGRIRREEIEFITRSGSRRTGLLSAEIIELWQEPNMLATIEDITETRRLEGEIMETGDRERRNIGQDLHDDLCPHLIGIEGLAAVLSKKLQDKSPGESELAEKITVLIQEAIRKSRSLARGLCPVYLVAHGLESSLHELSANVESLFGIPCRFHSISGPVLLEDNSVATQLFHIAQEAVNNAAKHGRATRIGILASLIENRLTLEVKDDGNGIPDAIESSGMGLKIMRFRANMIGADLNIQRPMDGGTVVSVTMNIEPGRKIPYYGS